MKDTKGKHTMHYYQEESKKYDKKRFESPIGAYIDSVEKWMVLKNLRKEKVLELCCGTGRFAGFLSKKGFKYFGVDFSKNMLEKAKIKNKGHKNIKFKLLDVKNLGKMPHNYFDNIFVARAIKFWQNPQQVIDDSYKLLRSNGRLILCFQSKDKSLSGFLMRLSRKIQDKFPILRSHKVGTEKYYYSKEIARFAKKAGFRVVSQKSYFNFFAYTWFMRNLGFGLQKLLAGFFRTFDNHFNFGWRRVIVCEKRI